MIAGLKKHVAAIVIFTVSVVIGLSTYRDYGVAWDDTTQREIGTVSYNYVFNGDEALLGYADKDYGVGFELPLIILEKQLDLSDTRDIFLMRHLVTHLFFLVSMFAGYLLIYRLFRNRLVACMGFVMLVFQPRIYAHSFFNTKDVPFLSMFLLSLFAIYLLQQKQKTGWYVLAGLVIGYTVATRIMGIVLFGFVSLVVLADVIRAYRKGNAIRLYLVRYFAFIVVFLLTLYAAWPYLWTDPVGRFVSAYNAFSHYRWEGEVLFQGRIIKASSLPWTYVPVWIGISTPVLWVFFAIAGIILLLIRFSKTSASFLCDTTQRNFVIYLLSVLIPVLAVILLGSVVYDDWRHLYFIYPPLVIIMLYAVSYFVGRGWKNLVVGAFGLQLYLVAVVMIREHPYQQVFFNRLVSHKEGSLKKKYEMDYWGCSYKEGLEWLLANKAGQVKVGTVKPLSNNRMFLPPGVRDRIVEVGDDDNPYYLVTNYRFAYRDSFPYPLIHRIKAQNSTVLDIYFVEK